MNNLLDIQGLTKHYNGFDLQGVDIAVPAGSVVGFVGSNGAGKTTMIKAALRLIAPDKGTIKYFGTPFDNSVSSKTIAGIKQRIGVVFDTCSFPKEITVVQTQSLMRAAYTNWNDTTFKHYLEVFNLPAEKKIKELSRGMGMKLTLACAFSHKPELLILDEPTAGLDPLAREEVLDILRKFMQCETHGILMSSHITSDLEKVADYIVCIDQGRLVFAVEKDAITDQMGIARCRTADFDALVSSGIFSAGTMRFRKHEYGIDVLVEDRFAFARSFKNIAIDKAAIDDYMSMMLKGGTR